MKKHLQTFANLFILIGAFILGAFVYRYFSLNAQPPETYQEITMSQDKLWQLVNNWRIENNLNDYQKDYFLCGVANEIIENPSHDFSKENPETQEFISIMNENGYSKYGIIASRDKQSERDILYYWITSAQKDILQDSFTHSCIRCENNYCVQLFAKY
jgi:hypothetical protein